MMKLAQPLLLMVAAASNKLLRGANAAAGGLCKSNVTVRDADALTCEIILTYVKEFRDCALRHYRSGCLSFEFHHRVTEEEFVNGFADVYPEDKVGEASGVAWCIDPLNYDVEMNLNPNYNTGTAVQILGSGGTNQNFINQPDPDPDVICSGFESSSGVRHNRLLNQIEAIGMSVLNDVDLQDFDTKCGDYEVRYVYYDQQYVLLVHRHVAM